jgi:integrase
MSDSNEKHNDIKSLDRIRAMLRGDQRGVAIAPELSVEVEPSETEDDDEDDGDDVDGVETESLEAESLVDAEPSTALALPPRQNGGAIALSHPGTGVVELYLATRRSANSARTMRDRLECAARLLGWSGDLHAMPWPALTAAHTDSLIAEMTRRFYSPSTINLTLVAVKGVLHQSWKLGLIDREAFARATTWDKISADGKRGTAGRELSQEELDKLAAYCRSLGPAEKEWPASAFGAMLEAVFALGVGGGLRATEICRIPMSGRSSSGKALGYDAAAQQIRFLAKGNRERLVTFGAVEAGVIERWLAVRAELDGVNASTMLVRVLPNGRLSEPQTMTRGHMTYLCETAARGAGVKHLTPHDLRRTFGTRAWRQLADGALVQRLMGHTNITTTVLYDKRGQEEDARVRRGVEMWRGESEKLR